MDSRVDIGSWELGRRLDACLSMLVLRWETSGSEVGFSNLMGINIYDR